LNKFSISPIPANLREINKPPRLTAIQLEEIRLEFQLTKNKSRKEQLLLNVGMKALLSGNEASEIFHIHRWSRVKTLENGSLVNILRCRRCELMKTVELFVEHDKSGRSVVQRLDRYVEPLATESSGLSAKEEVITKEGGSNV
jgi:hypothetical protein